MDIENKIVEINSAIIDLQQQYDKLINTSTSDSKVLLNNLELLLSMIQSYTVERIYFEEKLKELNNLNQKKKYIDCKLKDLEIELFSSLNHNKRFEFKATNCKIKKKSNKKIL